MYGNNISNSYFNIYNIKKYNTILINNSRKFMIKKSRHPSLNSNVCSELDVHKATNKTGGGFIKGQLVHSPRNQNFPSYNIPSYGMALRLSQSLKLHIWLSFQLVFANHQKNLLCFWTYGREVETSMKVKSPFRSFNIIVCGYYRLHI